MIDLNNLGNGLKLIKLILAQQKNNKLVKAQNEKNKKNEKAK